VDLFRSTWRTIFWLTCSHPCRRPTGITTLSKMLFAASILTIGLAYLKDGTSLPIMLA
jgi:hypothetical protein